MSSVHHWSIALIAALALATPASAQQGASAAARLAPTPSVPTAPTIAPTALNTPTLTPEPVTSVAPTSENSALGLHASTTTLAPSMVPFPQQRQSENVAMMIVGGAGLVVGSLIDGDTGTIVMVAGGVIGLVGLFRYLR